MDPETQEIANQYLNLKIELEELQARLFQVNNEFIKLAVQPIYINQVRAKRTKKVELDGIKQLVAVYEYQLQQTNERLLNLFKKSSVEPLNKLYFELEGNRYFDVWYTDKDEFCCTGPFSRL
jgi:hypothetical protein